MSRFSLCGSALCDGGPTKYLTHLTHPSQHIKGFHEKAPGFCRVCVDKVALPHFSFLKYLRI